MKVRAQTLSTSDNKETQGQIKMRLSLLLLICFALRWTSPNCICDRCVCEARWCDTKVTECMVAQEGFDDLVEISDGTWFYSFQSGSVPSYLLKLTQEESQQDCKDQGFDGLVSITSEEQRKFLHRTLMQSRVSYDFWTSMRNDTGDFKWLPGGSSFTNVWWWWYPRNTGKPGNCVVVLARAAIIRPIRCRSFQHRICQAKVCP